MPGGPKYHEECPSPPTTKSIRNLWSLHDLVKAFGTVNHDLLCQILLKYGLPTTLVQNVKKLYNNCKVKIKVGSDFTKLDYTTGVHQGDNM
jgi:hypothetical protein